MDLVALGVEVFGVGSLAVAFAKYTIEKRKTRQFEDHTEKYLKALLSAKLFSANFGATFFAPPRHPKLQRWKQLAVKLNVDGKEIPINEFVESILTGTIAGAVTTLHGVGEDWKKIEIKIER